MIAALKDRIKPMESLKPARAPPIADQEVENLEVSFLKKQVTELAGQLNAKEEAADHYRLKYKKIKEKYRQLKQERKVENNPESDLVKIGESILISRHKLALCRLNDYSKYTCDLLDVVFGRENLGNSVVKGIKGSTKNVLDQQKVSDLQGHVSAKFNVNVALVRASIRNKLNSAARALKCVK
ncbi:hypothetical protein JTE90_024758 [Oedothorax gibbosus]|uniref:BEN domain-containing protein n=1 Tax=Oedothorax gibbosus TaxID=931172 RepID=A0AAV6UBX5_9ARAC|nr:hypothetical protein JTE90_024758 [Oedothorax gibbosus]